MVVEGLHPLPILILEVAFPVMVFVVVSRGTTPTRPRPIHAPRTIHSLRLIRALAWLGVGSGVYRLFASSGFEDGLPLDKAPHLQEASPAQPSKVTRR